jgi:hypothetical protein
VSPRMASGLQALGSGGSRPCRLVMQQPLVRLTPSGSPGFIYTANGYAPMHPQSVCPLLSLGLACIL